MTDLKKGPEIFRTTFQSNSFRVFHVFLWFHATFEALLSNTCNFVADSGAKRIKVKKRSDIKSDSAAASAQKHQHQSS